MVYEACGFGFGLYRQLLSIGAHCYVIAPRKLDEQRTGVKTDSRDAATLCQRLSRYVEGNTKELAVIRVPSEEEERAQTHLPSARATGPSPAEARGAGPWVAGQPQPAGASPLARPSADFPYSRPPPRWKNQTWSRLTKVLPGWILPYLEIYRPALFALHEQITALTAQLEAAAPASIPQGMGKLTTVVVSREICDWHRFKNRRTISGYCQRPPALPFGQAFGLAVSFRSAPDFAPVNTAAATNGRRAA